MSEKDLMGEKEPQEKGLSEEAAKEIIEFVKDIAWPLIGEEEKGFPTREGEVPNPYGFGDYEKRVLGAKDTLRHGRRILVEIYKVFPHLKPDRIQQRDMGIYDLLREDGEME